MNLIYKKCVHVITVHSCKYVSVLYKFFNKTSVSPERSSWACIFFKGREKCSTFLPCSLSIKKNIIISPIYHLKAVCSVKKYYQSVFDLNSFNNLNTHNCFWYKSASSPGFSPASGVVSASPCSVVVLWHVFGYMCQGDPKDMLSKDTVNCSVSFSLTTLWFLTGPQRLELAGLTS